MTPVALTCGEPAGVGAEITLGAWEALRGEMPFVWIGDPANLGSRAVVIDTPAEAAKAMGSGVPVLAHPFPLPARLGTPDPANAQGVIDVIARAVDLVYGGSVFSNYLASNLSNCTLSVA